MGASLDDVANLGIAHEDSVTVLPGQAQQVLAELDGEPLSVLVLSSSFVARYPLAGSSEVTIGRSAGAEIYVDDPLVSRRHAVLAIGPTPTIRDLGSSNGTRVDGVRLEPAVAKPLAVGDVVLVGSAMLLLQCGSSPLAPRHFLPRESFEAHLDDECARSTRSGRGFVVACLQVGRRAPDVGVRETLAAALRTSDVVGVCGPGTYGIVLDATPSQARSVLERVITDLARDDATASWNLAQYPLDGRNAAELLIAAQQPRTMPRAVTVSAVIADPAMRDLYARVARIACGDIAVLIVGETGVGKEVMAEEIHCHSPRGAKPYLRLNCGAFSESLLESELFGHERGAFTSAVTAKLGLLETADGGTVLLDEIGEMPMSLQVKLLRVLEEKQVRRLGGVKSRPLEVRFIAATNRDLKRDADAGLFRKDLYYRLAGATLEIPPLRKRPADIEPLAREFLIRAAARQPQPPVLSADALAELQRFSWPGNIRELKHVIERSVLLAGAHPILPAHLSLAEAAEPLAQPASPSAAADDDDPSRTRVLEALAACGGNQSRAAKQLGISRGALIRRLERYGVVRPRKPD